MTGPIDATTVVRRRSAAGSCAQHLDEASHRRRARERHDVDAALQEHPVDVRLALVLGFRHDRAVGHRLGHLRAVLLQFLGDHFAPDVGARQEDLQATDVARLGQRLRQRFGAILGGHQIDLEPVAREPLGRRRPDRAHPDAAERPEVAPRRRQPLHERIDGVGAREHHPVEPVDRRARLVERSVVFRGKNADHRRLDGLRAERLEQVGELGGRFPRTGDENALAEQRPRVEPAQVLAQRGDPSDHQNGRTPIARLLHLVRQFSQRPDRRLLCRQGAVVDQRGRVVRRPAVRDERVQHLRQLIRARIADDGAVEAREARPVDRRLRLCPRPRGRARTSTCRRRPGRSAARRHSSPRRSRPECPEPPRSVRPARGETTPPIRRGRRRTGRPT